MGEKGQILCDSLIAICTCVFLVTSTKFAKYKINGHHFAETLDQTCIY